MTPKEYKEMMNYLTRSGVSKQVTFASDIARPDPKPQVKEIELFNEFNKRNPKADGGRIGFKDAGLSKKEKIAQGLEKGRVSKKLDDYFDAVIVYNNFVSQARAERDATILPKSFKSFLESRGLKEGTYGNLKNKLPELELPVKARMTLANDVIGDYNSQLKFKELNKILKNAKFTDKEIKALQVGNLDKADKAKDKARKAYDFLFKNNENSVNAVFNPRSKISELTGLTGETISKKFNVKEYDPDGFKMYENLSNPQVKKALQARIDRGANINIKNYFKEVENVKKGLPPTAAKLAAETRKGRLEVAAKKAGEGVADINKAQDETIALLNKFYKDNPQELLNNSKLRNLLDLTLKDGELVKKNKYVTDEDFLKLIKDKPGLFTKDHVDEVQFEKLSTEFPIFKQLATYNTNSGLIKSIKAYVAKNQNSTDPGVQNKIKKQIEFLEDLKLRIDTPTGRVGSKEVLNAVDRQAGTLPNFLAQLKALNIKLPAKAKAVLLGTGGGLAATTLATAGPIEETGSTAVDTAKTVGAATAGAATVGTKPGRKLLGKAFRTLGTPLAGSLLAADQVRRNIQSGENIADAVVDPLVGLELSFPGLFKENVSKITSNPTLQKVLKVGKFGRALTPIGAGITAAGLGIDAAKFTRDRIRELQAMSPEQRQELRSEGERQAFDPFMAAGGGIAKEAGDPSGRPPVRGPNSQGLLSLKNRVRNY
jgi:hypothetical protein